MRTPVVLFALVALASCGERTRALEYLCSNGPDIGITYEGGTATLYYPDGRVEALTSVPESPGIYTNASGTSWVESNRGGRLTTPERSLRCEQMGGR